MLSQEGWEVLKKEADYKVFTSRMERVLNEMIIEDITESDKFIDDDFGGDDWNQAAMLVTDSMIRTLWECYGDNIGDIIEEEV